MKWFDYNAKLSGGGLGKGFVTDKTPVVSANENSIQIEIHIVQMAGLHHVHTNCMWSSVELYFHCLNKYGLRTPKFRGLKTSSLNNQPWEYWLIYTVRKHNEL